MSPDGEWNRAGHCSAESIPDARFTKSNQKSTCTPLMGEEEPTVYNREKKLLLGGGGRGACLESQHSGSRGRRIRLQGQPGLQSEFQDSRSYTEKPCLEKLKPNKQKSKPKTNQKELESADKGMSSVELFLYPCQKVWDSIDYHMPQMNSLYGKSTPSNQETRETAS